MKQKFAKILPKSEFARNVLTLMMGTTIAQAIPVAISPILTRIYTPEDFGVLALFVAVTSIIGSVANGRYELAVMLPKKDEDAINIFALGIIIVTILSFVLLLGVVFFNRELVILLKNEEIGRWLYFVPLTVFFMGAYNMLNYFNNRQKKYKDLAKATVIKSIVLAITQMSIGFFKLGASGLITGQIFSQLSANIRLLKNIIKDKYLLSQISMKKIILLAEKYKKFPIYDTWSILSNSISSQLPSLLFAPFWGIVILGHYSFSYKIVSRPMSLIGSSISQVFFQKISSEVLQDKLNITVLSTYKKLLRIGLIPFFILFLYSDQIFNFVFGSNWGVAGYYTSILTPWLFVVFIVSPLSTVLIVYGKQKELFIFNLTLLIVRLILILYTGFSLVDVETVLILYSLVGALSYMLLLVYIMKLCGLKLIELSIYTIKWIVPIFVIGTILKIYQ